MTQLQDSSLAGVPTGLLIAGEWVTTDRTLEVDDPATGALLAQVSDATVPDALEAVASAHGAFGPWAATAPRIRAEVLRRAYEIMAAELEQCARLIVLENGKAWSDAMGEATYAAEFFRWFSEEASRVPRRLPAGARRRQDDHRRPPADGRGVHDHAVELPGGHGDAQARARPGGRLHRGPQAGLGDPADGAVGGRGPASSRASRPGSSTSSPPPTGPRVRGDPRRPAYGDPVLHGVDPGRQAAARTDRDPCPALVDGAGRQRAAARARGRGRRPGRRGRDGRQDAQRRSPPAPPPTASTSTSRWPTEFTVAFERALGGCASAAAWTRPTTSVRWSAPGSVTRSSTSSRRQRRRAVARSPCPRLPTTGAFISPTWCATSPTATP